MKFQSVIVPLALAVTGCMAELSDFEYEYHGNWEVQVSVKFTCNDNSESAGSTGGIDCDAFNHNGNIEVTFHESDGDGWVVESRPKDKHQSVRASPSSTPDGPRLAKWREGLYKQGWSVVNK